MRVGIVSGNLVQDRRDDPVDPHRGIYTTLDVGLAEHVFGSQRNFVRFLARNSTYYPLGKKLVLARSTEFGDIHAFPLRRRTRSDAIPLPERFFGGGGTSDRGFPENQAGPRDTGTGFPLGGTALLFQPDGAALPAGRRQYRRRAVSRHAATSIPAWAIFRSAPASATFRISITWCMPWASACAIARRSARCALDLAYSINPPYFYGFNGTQQQLINAGVDPCAGAAASARCRT